MLWELILIQEDVICSEETFSANFLYFLKILFNDFWVHEQQTKVTISKVTMWALIICQFSPTMLLNHISTGLQAMFN